MTNRWLILALALLALAMLAGLALADTGGSMGGGSWGGGGGGYSGGGGSWSSGSGGSGGSIHPGVALAVLVVFLVIAGIAKFAEQDHGSPYRGFSYGGAPVELVGLELVERLQLEQRLVVVK